MSHSEKIREALKKASRMNIAVAELESYGLSVKTIQGLESKLGIIYVEQFLDISLDDLKRTKNLGPVAIQEISKILDFLPLFILEKENENSNFV